MEWTESDSELGWERANAKRIRHRGMKDQEEGILPIISLILSKLSSVNIRAKKWDDNETYE